jgi:N-methylhydantoinase B
LPDVVFGCLHQAMGGRVLAEGASAAWQSQLRGGASAVDADAVGGNVEAGPDFDVVTFNAGGTGARPTKDGLSATGFPSGVRGMPVEATEQISPVVIWRKELRPDSGGAGEWRGGLGQSMEFGIPDGTPFAILAMFDRVDNPAKGRGGGANGAAGEVALASGRALRSKGQQTIPAGDRLRLELPGGGGHGDPRTRDAERVAEDVRDGLVSPEAAHDDYGVALDDDGAVDSMATEKIRSR